MERFAVVVSKVTDLWEQAYSKYKCFDFILKKDIPDHNYEYECIVCARLSKEELEHFPNLKQIVVAKTGIDDLPIQEINDRKIKLQSTHANAAFVAEHAVALCLALMRGIVRKTSKEHIFMDTLFGKKIGILGYGNIGKNIARLLKPYGGEICVYSLFGDEEVTLYDSVDELCKDVDVLFCSLPLSDQTRNLISNKELNLLRGKYVINVSRGEIFEESSMIEYLKEEAFAGFGTDVWYADADFDFPGNIISTPHCAADISDGRMRYIEDAISMANDCVSENNAKN